MSPKDFPRQSYSLHMSTVSMSEAISKSSGITTDYYSHKIKNSDEQKKVIETTKLKKYNDAELRV
jgi:hypothetical protein